MLSIGASAEIIANATQFLSTGDIIAIIASILSLSGVIVSTIHTNATAKQISRSNELLQERWNQKNIDASLTARAKIEWIQNVRKLAAELMGHYLDILNTADAATIEEALINSQQKTELLSLYFGPENSRLNTDANIKDRDMLMNTENNNDKNNVLVDFIIDLAQRLAVIRKVLKKTNSINSSRLSTMRVMKLIKMQHKNLLDIAIQRMAWRDRSMIILSGKRMMCKMLFVLNAH